MPTHGMRHPWKAEPFRVAADRDAVTITATLAPAPAVAPVKAPTRTPDVSPPWVMPDVWHEPATGLPWCDCGEDHSLTKRIISGYVATTLKTYPRPDRITHHQVVRTTMEVWGYVSVCRFFTLGIEDAAKRVAGAVADDYDMATGLAIIKGFSNRWNGCPTENCPDDWTAGDIESGSYASQPEGK